MLMGYQTDINENLVNHLCELMASCICVILSDYRTVIWDKNNTSPQGLQDVAAALEK